MKSYIIILIITLISCSNFPFKQKRMRDINLKGSFSILQDLVNVGIDLSFELFNQFVDIVLYCTDDSKSSKIINTINEYSKITEDFVKAHSFNNLIKLEETIKKEINGIKLNPEKIDLYMKHSDFPSEVIEFINGWVTEILHRDEKLINFQLFFSSIEESKKLFIDTQKREELFNVLNELIKNFLNEIKIEDIPIYIENIINQIKQVLKEIDEIVSQAIYFLKISFEIFKPLFNSKIKFDDFRKHFRTFFKVNQSTSIEDYDFLIKSYDILKNNLFKKIVEELKFQISFDYLEKIIINDFNILVHENHKGEAYASGILKIFEKIFIYYNVQNFISDFRNAVNALNNIITKIQKDGLNLKKWLPQLKDNLMNWKEENIKNIVNGILDHFKIIVTS